MVCKRVLELASMPEDTAVPVALITVTVILTLFTIVFGELVPKRSALAHPERVALAASRARSTSSAALLRSGRGRS